MHELECAFDQRRSTKMKERRMMEVDWMAKVATSCPAAKAGGRGVFLGWRDLRGVVSKRRRSGGFGIFCLAFLCLCGQARAGGGLAPVIQTQSTSPPGVLIPANWGPGTAGGVSPLSFQQFNPVQGTLLSIEVTMTTTIRSDYELIFPATPTPTTIDVATSQTTDPSVLANPALRALLTDGPVVTLFGPNGSTQLFGGPATRQPVDFVQMTESTGTYSSFLPVTSPNYVPPTMTQQTFSRSLTAADSGSLFAQFIGTGAFDLPVTASSSSSFYSSTGNGGGAVITSAAATVTIEYNFLEPQLIPEPSTAVLLGLGISIAFLANRLRRSRRAR
jgi:hypothetical protein